MIAPLACLLQPWLPDQVPGLMSRSPSARNASVMCCIIKFPAIRKGAHFDLGAPTTLALSNHVENSRLDELAPGQLANPPRDPATPVRRPTSAGARRSGVGPAAALGGVLGNRGAAREAGSSAARGAVPAAGRRLRREFRGLRIRQYRPAAQDPV